METKRLLIIGVGNPDRGDDGAGCAVIADLRARLDDHGGVGDIRLAEHWGEATSLVASMEGWQTVVIVDAATSGGEPGSYRRFDVGDRALPGDLVEVSSHGFGVSQAIELARALGSLPDRCVIYAIESRAFETGTAISPDVADAAEAVSADIMQTFVIQGSANIDEQRHA